MSTSGAQQDAQVGISGQERASAFQFKCRQAWRIASLQEYLTVAQIERQVEHATRQSDGSWLIREAGPGVGRVVLDTLRLELLLADIYERVELP